MVSGELVLNATVILVAYLLYSLAAGGFSAYVATEKRRSGVAWFWLGLLFGVLALIAIAGTPSLSASRDHGADASGTRVRRLHADQARERGRPHGPPPRAEDIPIIPKDRR